MSKNQAQVWLTRIALAVSVPVALIVGIVMFVQITSRPLHTDPKDVPSVTRSAPLEKWAGAVEQGRQIARTGLVDQNLPGLSVAVGVGQEIVWAEGFGWASLERRVAVAPTMRFRIGHASKALTSAAVGLLLEQGRLNLDDEIQKYVPEFPEKKWPVTLRQLMGHVAGIIHYRDTEWGDRPSGHCERASEGLQIFAKDPLMFEPQTVYKYSTYGWILVSTAVEAAAGESFFTFMRKQIFTPLGMADTTSDSSTEPAADRVTSYFRDNFGREVSPVIEYSCFAGASGFLSTPSDLVRFGMAINGGKLLQPATVKLLQTPQQLTTGKKTDYGLGWMIDTVPLAGEPARLASHASRTPVGGSTSFLTFPERGIVVAVTANTSFADARSIALQIAEVFAEHRKGPIAR